MSRKNREKMLLPQGFGPLLTIANLPVLITRVRNACQHIDVLDNTDIPGARLGGRPLSHGRPPCASLHSCLRATPLNGTGKVGVDRAGTCVRPFAAVDTAFATHDRAIARLKQLQRRREMARVRQRAKRAGSGRLLASCRIPGRDTECEFVYRNIRVIRN